MNPFIHTLHHRCRFRRYRRRRIPTIDAEEETAHRIQEGDRQAHAALVEANLRFAITVAKKYQNVGPRKTSSPPTTSKAADRFDPTKGFFISTPLVDSPA